jgi:hypothetical protein
MKSTSSGGGGRLMIRVLEDWTPPYPGFSYPGHRPMPAGLRASIRGIREVNP